MNNEYQIDRILAECSTLVTDERRRWPTALEEWCRLYGLRSADLGERLNISPRTVESWRDATKSDPPRFLIYALRYLEDNELPFNEWDGELFKKNIRIENNA